MSNRIVHATETNYVILTAEQFYNDFGTSLADHDTPPTGPVLVLTNDEGGLIAAVEGDNLAMIAELVGDLNDYAKAAADPGEVVAAVGRSSTVLPGR